MYKLNAIFTSKTNITTNTKNTTRDTIKGKKMQFYRFN
jgi:GTPase Era involved in 16S rRNA processing